MNTGTSHHIVRKGIGMTIVALGWALLLQHAPSAGQGMQHHVTASNPALIQTA